MNLILPEESDLKEAPSSKSSRLGVIEPAAAEEVEGAEDVAEELLLFCCWWAATAAAASILFEWW